VHTSMLSHKSHRRTNKSIRGYSEGLDPAHISQEWWSILQTVVWKHPGLSTFLRERNPRSIWGCM